MNRRHARKNEEIKYWRLEGEKTKRDGKRKVVKLRERGTSDKTNKSRQEETRHGGRKEDIEGEKIQDKTLKEKRRQWWRQDKRR